jgi:hypothetical protein
MTQSDEIIHKIIAKWDALSIRKKSMVKIIVPILGGIVTGVMVTLILSV